ncbi:hypothetical protein PVAP13_8NG059502 [Panicum virgatum]|uniref:Uncharacterized protein n=1 Tax=Panicum virgatum TaxID=38727 RepID=A0A8T0P5B2_PANVG|nr:hypothetical protein PVAP13_8NG059502 [Panicum virgatum]
MEGGLLDRGEGKEHTTAAAAAATGAHRTRYLVEAILLLLALAYAAFVLYETDKYTHSWIEKLQVLPLCIVAVAAPMLWAIMFGKKIQDAERKGGRTRS